MSTLGRDIRFVRLFSSLMALLAPLLVVNRAECQRAESYEYMSASSPLKNGWTVSSQTLPGKPISTVVTPVPLSGVNPSSSGMTLVPTSAQYPTTGTTVPAGGPAFSTSTTGGGSWVWVPNQGYGVAPGGIPVITQPTLGITSTNALKPVGGTILPPAGGPPGTTSTSVAANGAACQCGVPSVASPVVPPYTTGVPTIPFAPPPSLPGTIPTSSTIPTASAATGATTPTTAYYPYLTGNFQPIVATKNMPPGTYMGRGMFGQPTAYVDGQPMRNLFRYVFP